VTQLSEELVLLVLAKPLITITINTMTMIEALAATLQVQAVD